MITTASAPAEPGYEAFHFGPFVYDVAAALRDIAQTPDRPTLSVDVEKTARMLVVDRSDAELREAGVMPVMRGKVDEEYARTKADLSRPLLFADLSLKAGQEPAWMMIDGTHRLRRAVIEGVSELRAYALDREETLAIRSDARAR